MKHKIDFDIFGHDCESVYFWLVSFAIDEYAGCKPMIAKYDANLDLYLFLMGLATGKEEISPFVYFGTY